MSSAWPSLPSFKPPLLRIHRLTTACLTATACLAATACNNKREAPGGDAEEHLERPYDFTLLGVETCPLPAPNGSRARSVLGLRVRMTSRSDLRVAANYFYASLLTSDGSRYLAEQPGCEPILAAAPLAAGQSAEGFINVPVPAQKRPSRLQYLPPLGDTPEHLRVTELPLDTTTSALPAEVE